MSDHNKYGFISPQRQVGSDLILRRHDEFTG